MFHVAYDAALEHIYLEYLHHHVEFSLHRWKVPDQSVLFAKLAYIVRDPLQQDAVEMP